MNFKNKNLNQERPFEKRTWQIKKNINDDEQYDMNTKERKKIVFLNLLTYIINCLF